VSVTPTSLRAGVVGAGLMGRWHAHAIGRVGSRVVAVIDPDLQRARALAARLPARSVATADLERAIHEHGIQVVHVCAPLSFHEAITRQAIDAGVHALVEKPLAPDAATTARLHALASARGVELCPVHQFLFQRGVLRAASALRELGPIRLVDVVACSAGADGADDDTREQVAIDILPHGLALARRLLPAALADVTWQVGQGPPPGEIRATGVLAGASVTITVSMRSRPTENSLTLRCDHGTVRANLFHGYATIERGTPSRLDKLGRPIVGSTLVLGAAIGNLVSRAVRREAAYPGLTELVRRFHLACARLGPSPISVEESVDVARARDAIRDCRSRGSR
jgi:predicted dehydrogenase